MENATKALLIAAAIIIAVVLITLVVYVLNQGTTMVKENSDMSDVEITTYNTKFEAYLGTNVSGSKVKQLINTANQHNKTNSDDDSRQVNITGVDVTIGGDYTKGTLSNENIKSGKSYTVKTDATKGYTSGGLISTITIDENT